MIADLVGPERRPHAFGLMYVAINLGFAVGAALGGLLARYWFIWLFWADALTAVLNRFNRAMVLVFSAVLTGTGFGLIGLATSFWTFALTVVVWTAGEMMAVAFMYTIVTDLAPARLRARYLGVFTMCYSSAMMLGAPLGGAVLARLGAPYLWGGSLAVGLIAALLYFSIRKPMAPPRSS